MEVRTTNRNTEFCNLLYCTTEKCNCQWVFTEFCKFGTNNKEGCLKLTELYKKIENLCSARGITISEMCRESQVSRSALTELKMGRTKSLSYKALQKIANYFEVSVEIFSDDEEKKPDTDAELAEYLEYLKNRPEMRMLFSTLKGATKEDVEKAVRIIEALRNDGNG